MKLTSHRQSGTQAVKKITRPLQTLDEASLGEHFLSRLPVVFVLFSSLRVLDFCWTDALQVTNSLYYQFHSWVVFTMKQTLSETHRCSYLMV